MFDAQGVENGGMKIMNVSAIFNGTKAQFIGGPYGLPTFGSAAGHPHGKSVGIVVASVSFFTHGCSAKFAAPNNECVLKHAALLQIGEESRDGLIHALAERGPAFFVAGVCVPFAACAVENLNEANAAFDEATSHDAGLGHGVGGLVFQAIEIFGCAGLFGKIDGLWCFGLHAEGEFVCMDAGIQFGLLNTRRSMAMIHLRKQGKFSALTLVRDILRRRKVGNRLPFNLESRTLIRSRHEPRPPVTYTVEGHCVAIGHDDKGGKIFVLTA